MMLILTLLAISVIVLYNYFQRKNGEKKIPRLRMHEFMLVFEIMRIFFTSRGRTRNRKMEQVFVKLKDRFPNEGVCYIWGTFKHSVLIYKMDIAEQILKNDAHLQKGLIYFIFKSWLNKSLFLRSGDTYRSIKRMMMPLFKNYDENILILHKQANTLVNEIAEAMESQDFLNIEPLIARCTLDIAYEKIVGINLNSQSNPELPFFHAIDEIINELGNRLVQPWLWPDFIYFWTKSGRNMRKYVNIVNEFTSKSLERIMRETSSHRVSKPAKFNAALENSQHIPDQIFEKIEPEVRKRRLYSDVYSPHLTNGSISFEEALNNINGLLFAGYDTVGTSVSWALYNIGLYPEIQCKVHEELDFVLGDINEVITEEKVKELKYLECVFKETLRLFPPVSFISRTLGEDLHTNGYTLRKGTSCEIFIQIIQKDPNVFPDPEIFDPNRFKPSNGEKCHHHAFIPFSAGIRHCLGQKFAMLEGIILLATVLRRFEVKSMQPLDEIDIVHGVILKSNNGLFLSFKPRKIQQKTEQLQRNQNYDL